MADDASFPGQLGVLLACYEGRKTAGRVRRGLTDRLRTQGDQLLDTIVLQVDGKHKATTHDPRKVMWAAVTAGLVWAVIGLAGSHGLWSVLFWGALGAIGGILFLYYSLRHLTKSELARIGSALPADSSALSIWVGTQDARLLLEAAASSKPTGASAASIGTDLSTQVFVGAGDPVETPAGTGKDLRTADTVLSLVTVTYPSPETAKQMALHPPVKSPLEVEMAIQSDPDGHRHVTDPSLGVHAAAKVNLVQSAVCGLVFGVVVGLAGGGDLLGLVERGIWSAVIWGIAGFFLGALYGYLFLKSFSPRGLKGVASFCGSRHVGSDGLGRCHEPAHHRGARRLQHRGVVATRPQLQLP